MQPQCIVEAIINLVITSHISYQAYLYYQAGDSFRFKINSVASIITFILLLLIVFTH